MQRPSPLVSLEALCSGLNQILKQFKSLVTIEQLANISQEICIMYKANHFDDLYYDEKHPEQHFSLIDILNTYPHLIDPENELLIYDKNNTTIDHENLLNFCQQLRFAVKSSETVIQEHALPQVQQEQKKEQCSIIEKVAKHKFGQSIGFRRATSILEQINEMDHSQQKPIIR